MTMKNATACMIGSSGIRMTCRIDRLKSWAVLTLSVLAVLLFMFVLGPMGLRTETLKPMADFIEENSINANAYYYTEVEEFFEAERHMREHLGKH